MSIDSYQIAPCDDTYHNFPRQNVAMTDREQEQQEITQRLNDPNCQLLTLVGPGGIGKTRLAIAAAQAAAGTFCDGIYFVDLQPVHSAEFLIPAICDALGVSTAGQGSLRETLLDFLRDKEMLLLLDNFEQLAEQGIDLLVEILTVARDVKVLVTSRTVLNLQEEWIYPVHGLPYPTAEEDEAQLESYGAVQLFVERARRVRRTFSLEDERAGVVHLCQLTEGVPLALELAAAWTKSLSCSAIADEIERNLAFLTTHLRNAPEQHRSMRAVYDQTWALLTPGEQQVFQQLAVFHGGFRRTAAEQVAGATLPILSSLLDKSLLRWEANGRYQIHELLRQYAEEQLNADADAAAATRNRHSAYFAKFLHERTAGLTQAHQHQIVEEIALELENIRTAWNHALTHARIDDIDKATQGYYAFCDFRGRYQEGADAFEKAISALDGVEQTRQARRTIAMLQVMVGWHYIRLGQLDEAQAVFEAGWQQFNALGATPPPGFGTDPRLGLGLLAVVRGDYEKGTDLAHEARQAGEAHNDLLNLQIAHYILETAAFSRGEYQQAGHYAQQAYVLTKESGNRWMMAYILSELGNIARMLGDYDQAQRHYQASYDIKDDLNDPEGCAAALWQLAYVYYLQESYQAAHQLYQESLEIYQKINDRGGLARALFGLGLVALAANDYESTRQHFQAALNIAIEMQFVPLLLDMLTCTAKLFFGTERQELGVRILEVAWHHPARKHETQKCAEKVIQKHGIDWDAHAEKLAPSEAAAALDALIATVQTELATPYAGAEAPMQRYTQTKPSNAGISKTITSTTRKSLAHMLVEPLTDREQEVLELVADGLTNKEIANRLIISAGTVKWYTGQIYGKLGVNKRTQAVARARELSLLN